MPNLGQVPSATDSTRVGQATSPATFSALLHQQERSLGTIAAASPTDPQPADGLQATAFGAEFLFAAVAPPALTPSAESNAGAALRGTNPHGGSPHSASRQPGELLPNAGNLLPPALAGTSPATQAATLPDGAPTQPAALTEQGAGVPGAAPSTGTANAGSPLLSKHEYSGLESLGRDAPGVASQTIGEFPGKVPSEASRDAEARTAAALGQLGGSWLTTSGRSNSRPTLAPSRVASHAQQLQHEGLSATTEAGNKFLPAGPQSASSPEWGTRIVGALDNVVAARPTDVQGSASLAPPMAAMSGHGEGLQGAISLASGVQQTPLPGLYARTIETPFGSPTWGTELLAQVRSLAGEGGLQRAELRLNPAHLGPLEVTLSVRGDETNITFIAPEGMVRDALQETLPRLRELLAEQGLNLGQTRVLDHSADGAGRQPSQGQLARNGYQEAAGGTERGSAESGNRSSATLARRSALIDAYI